MSDMEDGVKEAHSRSGSRHSEREDGEDSKHERYSNNSRERSRSRISDGHKSHSRRDYSRSRSRSHSRSRKSHRSSRYRSRSRSPKRYKSSRYMYSRSRSGSYSPSYKSSRRDRSRSRSPMSNRRRHLGNRWGKKPYKNTNSKDNPLPSRCLGVFGLSIYTTEQQLNHIFSKFGPIEKVQVIIDAKTGRSRGFCFVYFENHEDAKAAKEQCTGMEIDGRQIRVDYSITLRAHTPTPGIYMGKPTYMEDRKWKHRNYDDYHYGGGGGRYNHYKRSPSPYFRNRRRYNRSRSYSYSPRRY